MSASYVGGEPNFENRTLYHGDNLDFLRGMNSETVHLIATDPPFNKNRDFYATPDKLAAGAKFQDRWIWKDETHGGWFNRLYETHREAWYAIMCAFQSYGSDMGAFIAFLSVRLIEMHRILRNDGCISLHCDQTASHYIKGLMDAIFGSRNFRNEIIWMRDPAGKGAKRRSNQWPRNFDSILLYSKSADYTFTQQFTELNEHQKKAYRYQDEVGRYKAVQRGDYTDKSMAKFRAEGKIHVSKTGKEYIKYYLKDAKATIGSVWTDIYGFGTITASKERTGFPTQKPLALYERIILASSNKGDIVLDPFCGCATTPVAAERLKRHWVGMDIWDEAYKQVIDRLERDTVLRYGQQGHVTLPEVKRSIQPPLRSDDGEPAVQALRTPIGHQRKRYPPPRSQHGKLISDIGAYCQGCGNSYGFDPRVLEVDHIRPRSDGGSDAYDNLTLLCPPCNREKRDRYTLSYLQQINRKAGYLKQENEKYIVHGKGGRRNKRNRKRR